MMIKFPEGEMVDDNDDDCSDEFTKLIRNMNPPRVVIDNDSCEDATVIRVDSVNKHGILLQVVQVLTDLNLIIRKAYISSDGSWFMDVFNVTDRDGGKVLDEEIISYLQKSLESDAFFFPKLSSAGTSPSKEHTLIEFTASDRPGLLSEVSAVLATRMYRVARAELWTHNARVAAVLRVVDESTGGGAAVAVDLERLSAIKQLLCNVLEVDGDSSSTGTMGVASGSTHTQRRLHQMMVDDRDYERGKRREEDDGESRPRVAVRDCVEKEYTEVIMRPKDRAKLVFDTLCTLTDMKYIVFHGTVSTGEEEAYQEYYIRNVDGSPVSSEEDRRHLIQCLEAAT
ncbi:ACT domain-containing protein ACR6 isoform X2 [Canna indica]|uniref:ACT domain-containing protein ACR n=1 Tax=Canna indica TaxID=4628 RepID=A0AAQ3Q7R0_9LILI|nr:ACT domain-containing protein ACR6 isoform X2 [Canna indica]